MTRQQQVRLRASWVPAKARDYVELLDSANHTKSSLELVRIQDRSSTLLRRMTDDEYNVATHLLHTMQREDAMRYR